jgi:membrane-associated phospholipid phosphatase
LVRVALWYGLTWRAVSQAKDLFDRHRPDAVARLDQVTGSSYPSGHVAAVAAADVAGAALGVTGTALVLAAVLRPDHGPTRGQLSPSEVLPLL